MFPRLTKRSVLVAGVLFVILLVGITILITRSREKPAPPEVVPVEQPVVEEAGPQHTIIGTSVEGRAIEAYTFGSGATPLLFVGGVHGGYEWNSVLLAYNMIDYLSANPEKVPDNLTVTIVPSANPDGVFKVLGVDGRFTREQVPADEGPAGTGRFNAHDVDLNRNFDCKWKATSSWRGNTVSAGTAPFSEPEAQAIRNLVLLEKPVAVIFWHSQSNAVYASECTNGILPATRTLMNTYAQAAGYPAVDVFDSYEITGDAEGWLASIGIPAVTVELSTHATVEWEKNLAGMKAVLAHYASSP